MKTIFKVISLIFIFTVFAFSISIAEQPKIKEEIQKTIPGVPSSYKADLAVDRIFASSCKCDISDVDAFYMNRIIVTVSQAAGGVEVNAEVKVTYYDLSQGRSVTVTKVIPSIKPYPTNPWAIDVTMVDRPVLVKKSAGIKAEVKPIRPFPGTDWIGTVTDLNLSNNVKTVYQCDVMIY